MTNSNRTTINRRSFLKTATPFALGVCATVRGQVPTERGRFSEDHLQLARQQLLDQVNADRAGARLSQLKLDELACRVADAHARDMVERDFLSHWGSDGLKPYQRYSFAGGTDALQENVSSAQSIESVTANAVFRNLHQMHQSMIEEVPPHDGHRKTILFPQLTHVGFGIAMQGHNLRMDQLYLARYLELDPIPRQSKVRSTVTLRGRVLSPINLLTNADVFFEPLPSPPEIEWLRQPRSYGLPKPSETLLPQLPAPYFYPDGSTGTIELKGGRFQTRVKLSHKPGINTLVIWLKSGSNGTGFPASEVSIRVE